MRPTKSSSGPVPGQAQRPPGLAAVAGAEEGVVDPGGHDADPGGVGAVELGDLGRLHRARRQHGVRAADDGGLGLGPLVGGVGLDLFRAGLGLDPVEGVEGGDQRQVQLVLDQVAGHAAQPVVGVDGVEGQVLRPCRSPPRLAMRLSTPSANSSTTVGRASLAMGVGGPAETWCTRRPGSMSTGGRQVVGPGPGEHVARHPGPGQRRGQLAHVDVHAAAVPGARLGQGRGVQGKDGQTPHAPTILPGRPRSAGYGGGTAPTRDCGGRVGRPGGGHGRVIGSAARAASVTVDSRCRSA